ncbi:MAG: hypothetical protein ABI408_08290 [Gemmatimonadaceae bacterium]
MHVVRDVLDKKLLDHEDESMGRIDGLVMQIGKSSQPRITHIAVGGATLWARVHPTLGRIARRMAGKWGPKRREKVRIPWSRVRTVGRDVTLDVEAKHAGAIDWEIWIARHIVERIPGGGHEEPDDGD